MQEPWSVFPAVLERYEDMLTFILGRARDCGVPEKRLLRMQLGFEEAVVNIISYAYDKAAPGKVWLRAWCEAGSFQLEMADSGRPFNPLVMADALEHPGAEPLEEKKISGLGIAFIRRVFDEVSYSYEAQEEPVGNRLRLVIRLTPAVMP